MSLKKIPIEHHAILEETASKILNTNFEDLHCSTVIAILECAIKKVKSHQKLMHNVNCELVKF